MDQVTGQSRHHRRFKIVAHLLGDTWTGVIHAPGSNAIVKTFEAASVQEVMVRGVGLVNELLIGKA